MTLNNIANAFAYAFVITCMGYIAYLWIDTGRMTVKINQHVNQSIGDKFKLNLPTMNQGSFK